MKILILSDLHAGRGDRADRLGHAEARLAAAVRRLSDEGFDEFMELLDV